MNTTQAMRDPAAGVNISLLPHMHLISKNRYPITNNPSLETIVGYLLEAPKIVRDLQPVQWQFLDAPTDGTLMLTWQPTEQLGTNFASDGYIYGDVEQSFQSDVRGYTLEMFHQRSGYRSGEPMASHSRRRYRLLTANPAMPSVDPALFIIHYSKAHPRDTIPAAQIQIPPHIAQQIHQRRAIQAQGQLARKDFMLHDRSNWPQINPPHGMGRAGPGHRRGASMGNETTVEEEEDVSRGDILDFMTPRDISKVRYEQHHEWMEEVLESPYHIHQIIPGDLGLGRKGELEELTKDFFDAPTAVVKENSGTTQPDRVGKMAQDRAEDFKKRATQKIAEMQAEIDRMKQQHAKRMVKMQRTTLLNSAERKLRSAPTAASGRTMSTGSLVDQQDIDPLEEIAQEVESSIGKKIERVATVTMVSRGGLQERQSERTFSTSSANRPVFSPVKNTASPNVTQSAFSQQNQGNIQQQEAQYRAQAGGSSENLLGREPVANGGPIGDLQQESEAKVTSENEDAEDGDLPPLDDMGMDVDMDALVNDDQDDAATPAGNDWVMVDGQAERNTVEVEKDPADMTESRVKPEARQGQQEDSAEQAQPPAPSEEQPPEDSALDDNDFGGDFDNVDVDTAGDALASYEDGDDEDLNLDAMDDSAFGDAFHPDEDADIS